MIYLLPHHLQLSPVRYSHVAGCPFSRSPLELLAAIESYKAKEQSYQERLEAAEIARVKAARAEAFGQLYAKKSIAPDFSFNPSTPDPYRHGEDTGRSCDRAKGHGRSSENLGAKGARFGRETR